jgi:membrane fusion protein
VRLRLAAYPYQKFGHLHGRVTQVSRVPLAASELAALALGPGTVPAGQPLFRITVALEAATSPGPGAQQPSGTAPGPAALPLAAGMQLSADVQLEQRRLIEWLLEPALGWRSRQAG